jgi:hypothetical protein
LGGIYHLDMSTLREIESAARRLSSDEKRRLLIFVAQILREEDLSPPAPRTFSSAEMEAWMDEDERDMREFRGQR